MPTPDASSFTQFKRLKALEARTDTQKTITHLYQPQVTTSGLTNFLPSFTNKFTTGTRYIPIGFPITNPAPVVPPAPVPIEVDFAGTSVYPTTLTFPSSTSILFHFTGVGGLTLSSLDSITFNSGTYDFTGSTIIITDPIGYSVLDTNFTTPGYGTYKIKNSPLTNISDWVVTLTVSNPIDSLDSIAFTAF